MSDVDAKLAALHERVENIAENVTYLRQSAERTERLHGTVGVLRWIIGGAWAAILAIASFVIGHR